MRSDSNEANSMLKTKMCVDSRTGEKGMFVMQQQCINPTLTICHPLLKETHTHQTTALDPQTDRVNHQKS